MTPPRLRRYAVDIDGAIAPRIVAAYDDESAATGALEEALQESDVDLRPAQTTVRVVVLDDADGLSAWDVEIAWEPYCTATPSPGYVPLATAEQLRDSLRADAAEQEDTTH